MKLTISTSYDENGFLARINELDCYGDGETEIEAIEDVMRVGIDVLKIYKDEYNTDFKSDCKLVGISIDEGKNDWIEIRSEDLSLFYANGMGCHGLQCNVSDDEKYIQIKDMLAEITDKFRLISELIASENSKKEHI